MTSTTQIVKEHIAASKLFRKSLRGNVEKSRDFLIKAGILTKDGKRLSKRYR